MSGNDESSSSDEEEHSFDDDEDYFYYYESSKEKQVLWAEDRLFAAVNRGQGDDAAAAAVQLAIRDGANVNVARENTTPLIEACRQGSDEIVYILLDAGADARWSDSDGWSAIFHAIGFEHLSTVKLLINHDNRLLETVNDDGSTPLIYAILEQHSDIVRLLLDSSADAHHVDRDGLTTLMYACEGNSLEIVRQLLAAGVAVEARDKKQQTALHHAASSDVVEVVRELILQRNADMFAVDRDGRTPYDLACRWAFTADVIDHLLEVYGSKLTQDHGRLALHELVKVAEYSFDEDEEFFHPPLNLLEVILPLGKLTLKHLRSLLHTFDPELIRNRDDTGKLPIHIVCQANAPVEVLDLILDLDPAVLHIADFTGALPIHLLCGTTTVATEYASVRYLVEQGGVGTLAARNQQGASPLHVLCGSTNPPLRAVQYLIQSFPMSLSLQTNAGQYPLMMAAAGDSSSASLSVIYEVVRANPDLVVPR